MACGAPFARMQFNMRNSSCDHKILKIQGRQTGKNGTDAGLRTALYGTKNALLDQLQ